MFNHLDDCLNDSCTKHRVLNTASVSKPLWSSQNPSVSIRVTMSKDLEIKRYNFRRDLFPFSLAITDNTRDMSKIQSRIFRKCS